MTACCLSTLRDWGHTDCPQATFPVRTPPRMVTQPLPQPRGRRSWHKAHGHCPPHPDPAGGPGRPGGPCIPLSPPEETQAWDQPPERPAEPANLRGVQTHLDGNIWPHAPAGQCLHKTPGPICKGTGWPLAQDPSARVTMPLEGRQLSQVSAQTFPPRDSRTHRAHFLSDTLHLLSPSGTTRLGPSTSHRLEAPRAGPPASPRDPRAQQGAGGGGHGFWPLSALPRSLCSADGPNALENRP
ncbi:uncharacterized protein LOC131517832 [Neofelis nebulosa]|uniref:uncharacterized protein LOC131517832 n=1 Tax=Neofelis nebulosa TaxID=61452 RepID=UPI00272C88C6|nr:uncharacterized protein LOC131517832 [Neofelis nebulosa]